MSLPVRFSAEAAAEFSDAAAWYGQRRVGLDEAFISAVETALGVVSEWPRTGVLVADVAEDLEIRRARIARFPYHLVYVVADDHLRVLAVAHDRRRPGYWAARTSR